MEISGRKAHKVDADIKAANLKRLGRIEGQIRGIAKMVEGERYCADILMQVTAVQEALRAVSRELLRNHLQHCATEAIRKGPAAKAHEVLNEVIDMMHRSRR